MKSFWNKTIQTKVFCKICLSYLRRVGRRKGPSEIVITWPKIFFFFSFSSFPPFSWWMYDYLSNLWVLDIKKINISFFMQAKFVLNLKTYLKMTSFIVTLEFKNANVTFLTVNLKTELKKCLPTWRWSNFTAFLYRKCW